ncbi:unnamed protein product [Linum trigynum]|uniref:F-box domain-containing protein n=1 Tax=Linum trigynum TaxID=586398 RepID=A0AAV2DQG2_9ROSI
MNNLVKGVKRSREEENETSTTTDRLSHLPRFIIHHILSFLDAKSAVQTSVLSRVWRCAWKYVPVLSFHRDSFEKYSSFLKYVDRVLSLRFRLDVRTVSFIDGEKSPERTFFPFAKVIKYALSHEAQHLVIDLQNGEYIYETFRFCYLFGMNLNCNLKTLKLRRVSVDTRFDFSGFQMLNDLNLEQCLLCSLDDENVDPFAGFPCLKNLVLTQCLHTDFADGVGNRSFKISGLQLLSLKLDCLLSLKIEICAPKLEFFALVHDLEFLNFSNLSIPSLVHADIRVSDEEKTIGLDKERRMQHLIALLHGLNNATSLKLDNYTIQVLCNIDTEFLEQQTSPFTKLKSLKVGAVAVPSALLGYFLKGSSMATPNVEYGYV